MRVNEQELKFLNHSETKKLLEKLKITYKVPAKDSDFESF